MGTLGRTVSFYHNLYTSIQIWARRLRMSRLAWRGLTALTPGERTHDHQAQTSQPRYYQDAGAAWHPSWAGNN